MQNVHSNGDADLPGSCEPDRGARIGEGDGEVDDQCPAATHAGHAFVSTFTRLICDPVSPATASDPSPNRASSAP